MNLPHLSPLYEKWAPALGRVLLASVFLSAAVFKIPGSASSQMEIAMTAARHVPLPEVAVFLALLLEVGAGLALALGWYTRLAAFLLALFTALLTAIFHMSFAGPADLGQFFVHLGLIGGLLYISVYGAQGVAIVKCPLPHGLSRSE